MAKRIKDRRAQLADATLKLVSAAGIDGATVRAITRAAGVTEGALYRHYRSKEELYLEIYRELVTRMIAEKEALLSSAAPLETKLREWVRISYTYFDENREGFAFVFLTRHAFPPDAAGFTSRQGALFIEWMRAAADAGEIRPLLPELAMTFFSGLLLNIPRRILEGGLPGPAAAYVAPVAAAACRLLRP